MTLMETLDGMRQAGYVSHRPPKANVKSCAEKDVLNQAIQNREPHGLGKMKRELRQENFRARPGKPRKEKGDKSASSLRNTGDQSRIKEQRTNGKRGLGYSDTRG